MNTYLKEHYKLLLFNLFFILFLIFVCMKFLKSMSNILNILYVQNSPLNVFYNDFYIANNLNPSDEIFIETLRNKDQKLYHFFKDRMLILEKNEKGKKNFVWKSSSEFKKNIKLSDFLEQSFLKILFFNENILIEFNNDRILGYQENTIYKYDNHSFIKKSTFDRYRIQLKYAEKMNCKPHKIFVEDSFKQSIYILIQSGNIHLVKSDFSSDSQKIIKDLFQDIYKREKDTFLINLHFYNIEDAICLE